MSLWCPSCESWTAAPDPEKRAEAYCSTAGCGWEGKFADAKSPGQKMDDLRAQLAERDAQCAAMREALRKLAGAANAVYIEDDAFTATRDGDGRIERDDALGEAIHSAVVALGIGDASQMNCTCGGGQLCGLHGG